MKQARTILFAGDQTWALGRADSVRQLGLPAGADAAQVTAAVAAVPDAAGQPVTLAVPSVWCLSSTLPLDGIPARNRRKALLYRLELAIPIPIEEITADYIFNEPRSALAVCISDSCVKPFVDALESAGITVQSIVPASLLAARSVRPDAKAGGDAVLWQSADVLELILFDQTRIVGWYVFPADASDLRRHVDHAKAGRPSAMQITTVDLDPALMEGLSSAASVVLRPVTGRSVEQEVMAAAAAGIELPVDLRRDGLGPKDPYRTLRRKYAEPIIAVVILIGCVCGAACWRGIKLGRLADESRAQQAAVYHDAFPDRPVPPNILTRLQSERRASAEQGGPSAVSARRSILPEIGSLLWVLANLPPEVRVQIEQLRQDTAGFSIDGIARNRTDLNAIVDSLTHQRGWKVNPAQTEPGPGKAVRFSISGTYPAEVPPR